MYVLLVKSTIVSMYLSFRCLMCLVLGAWRLVLSAGYIYPHISGLIMFTCEHLLPGPGLLTRRHTAALTR